MQKEYYTDIPDDTQAQEEDKLFLLNLKPYNLKWYPGGITCVSSGKRCLKPSNVPPLMVRKAPWRK
ncbi:MAG: hypothetical protein WC374_08780 [Phycisphaerae bacterium]|jgi:hypothetical protein